jgi:quinol-cytochrome oxidoreductase complex cytochrome b subunit
LFNKEVAYALVWIAILLGWSMLVPAPLEDIANPAVSPNPAKAAWYFLGLQELILHFHPVFGAVIIPGAAILLLFLLPFYDHNTENEGIYFRSRSGRNLALLGVESALILTPLWILLDEYVLKWSAWFPTWPSILTTGVFPTTFLLFGLILLDRILHGLFYPSTEERVLFWMTFFFFALIVLTITGIFFRGPGMALYLPWHMPAPGH